MPILCYDKFMKRSSSVDDELKSVRELIENGQIQNAVRDLDNLDSKRLRRSELLTAARLYRRAAQFLKTIELLRPLVRPTSKLADQANDEEKLEYAVALTGLGSVIEARELLSEVENKELSLYFLYTAFNCIKQWNYAEAIDPLEKYLGREKDFYAQSVAKVNLLQAYLYCGRRELAVTFIDDKNWQAELAKKKKHRLLGNLEELKAQYFFQTKKWPEALECLEQAHSYLEKSEMEKLFVQKWQFLVKLFSHGADAQSQGQWMKLRLHAQGLGHQETVRDLDYHYGYKTRQLNILKYVYWGTPFLSYKALLNQKLISEFSMDLTQEDSFYRPLEAKNEAPAFDEQSPLPLTLHESNISRSPLLQKLFAYLNSDFYRGMSVYAIHDAIYTGEYFNPLSSPERVRQGIHRLRDCFRDLKAPIEIDLQNNHYRLHSLNEAPVGIVSYRKNSPDQSAPAIVAKIRECYAHEIFKLKDLSERLNMPSRTLSTQVKKAIEEGFILKISSGPQAQYKLKDHA